MTGWQVRPTSNAPAPRELTTSTLEKIILINFPLEGSNSPWKFTFNHTKLILMDGSRKWKTLHFKNHVITDTWYLILNFPMGRSFQNSPRELVLSKVFKILKRPNANVFVSGNLSKLSQFQFNIAPLSSHFSLCPPQQQWPCWLAAPAGPPPAPSLPPGRSPGWPACSPDCYSTQHLIGFLWGNQLRIEDFMIQLSDNRGGGGNIKSNNICLLYRNYGKYGS